jgi:Rho GDP-dissociation inhibitor
LKEQKFDIKQGIKYTLQISFYVQRDIVTGLKYTQTIKRGIVKVEKLSQMVGSYAPKADLQIFTTEEEEMPAGILCFGTYDVESAFVDDDNHVHLKWDWSFKLKKNWDEK